MNLTEMNYMPKSTKVYLAKNMLKIYHFAIIKKINKDILNILYFTNIPKLLSYIFKNYGNIFIPSCIPRIYS